MWGRTWLVDTCQVRDNPWGLFSWQWDKRTLNVFSCQNVNSPQLPHNVAEACQPRQYQCDFSLGDGWDNFWDLSICFLYGRWSKVFLPPSDNIGSWGQHLHATINSVAEYCFLLLRHWRCQIFWGGQLLVLLHSLPYFFFASKTTWASASLSLPVPIGNYKMECVSGCE